jgi:hypothetical protein
MQLHEILNESGQSTCKTIIILSAKKVTKENDSYLYNRGVRLISHCKNTKNQEFVIYKMSNGHFNKSLMITK